MKNETLNKKRIQILDEVRGLAVFMMILYHGYYVCGAFFNIEAGSRLFAFFKPAEPFFAAIFISACGISTTLSHNNLRRSFKILAGAAGFTLATVFILPRIGFPGFEDYFGILHFLGFSVLICALASKLIDRINPYYGILACAVLYPFFSPIEQGMLSYGEMFVLKLPRVLYSFNYLMPLGFHTADFTSADYFPLFPHIFIFLFGVFLGRIYAAKGWPEGAYRKRIPFLGVLGRHAFIIYIIHMPVWALIAYIITLILN